MLLLLGCPLQANIPSLQQKEHFVREERADTFTQKLRETTDPRATQQTRLRRECA